MNEKNRTFSSYREALFNLYGKLDKKEHSVLTKEEEYEMLKQIKESKNNKAIVDKFVNHNIDLIVSIANKVKQTTPDCEFELMDLINEGVIGMYKAIERFDLSSGNKFSTYATYWIRAEISRAVVDKGKAIRKPVYFVELMKVIKDFNSDFYAENGKDATSEEISNMLTSKGYNYSLEKVQKYLEIEYASSYVSIDIPTTTEDEEDQVYMISSIKDESELINPAENLYKDSIKDRMFLALDCLRPIEKEIIILKFGLKDGITRTRKEIGQMLNLPEIRIYNLEQIGLKKLRKNKIMEEYKIYKESKENLFLMWLSDHNEIAALKDKTFADETTYLEYYIENKDMIIEKIYSIFTEEESLFICKNLLELENNKAIKTNKRKNKRVREKN